MKAKKLKLTRGLFALIDEDDYERASKLKWYVTGRHPYLYAATGHKTSKKRVANGNKATDTYITLHRFIANAGKDAYVDHINRDTLDNRKQNLRLCSHSDNLKNSKMKKMKFKGVSYDEKRKTFTASIKDIELRGFSTESDAVRAYDQIAKYIYSEFAYLNNIGNRIF